MSIFKDAMLKAIADYRLLLRRHLAQADRIQKLQALRLRDYDPEDEVMLHEIGYLIVNDIQENMDKHGNGYYAYSGVRKFGEFLKEFLDQYQVKGSFAVHREQEAAKAMLDTIQYVGMSAEQLTDDIAGKLKESATAIAHFGTEEQKQHFMRALEIGQTRVLHFYDPIVTFFEEQLGLGEGTKQAEAA